MTESSGWDPNAQGNPGAPPPPPPGTPPPPPAPPMGGYAPAPYAGAPAYGYGGPALPPAVANQQLATYGQRVGAYLIDALFALTIVGAIIIPIMMGREGEKNGMSLGKQLLGIRVVREDGAPVTVGFAFVREWAVRGLLFGIGGSFFCGIPGLIDLLWPLWDKPGQQTLHDKVCSTYVTVAPQNA